MPGFLREHSWPVVASVALHGLLVVAVLLSMLVSNRPTPPNLQPLPIDAVVIDAPTFHAAQRTHADRVAQDAARIQAATDAKAAADAQAAADAKAAADARADADARANADTLAAAQAQTEARAAVEAKAAADQRAQEQADAAATAAAAADAKSAAASQVQRRADAEKAAAAGEAAEAAEALRRATAARKALEARQAADAKQAAEAKQAVEAQQAADAKRAADDRAKKDREAELRRQMADEEHVSAVESGPLRGRYITLLRNKIQNAWIKPPSALPGVDCMVAVTQVPGGEVTAARVTQCNGDAAVRQSIENAVYRSSPLPDPPDPALFERNFVFRFRPNE